MRTKPRDASDWSYYFTLDYNDRDLVANLANLIRLVQRDALDSAAEMCLAHWSEEQPSDFAQGFAKACETLANEMRRMRPKEPK